MSSVNNLEKLQLHYLFELRRIALDVLIENIWLHIQPEQQEGGPIPDTSYRLVCESVKFEFCLVM
jgi:hypothetical protein